MKVLKRDIQPILEILKNIQVPINYDRERAKKGGAGRGRSVLLGENIRKKGVLTKFTQSHPELYQQVQALARKYIPFAVKHFMLNKNYQTQPHRDSKNVGESIIFSFGDYEGGDLIIEGRKRKTHLNMVRMNGSTQTHWNLPITKGTRYSLIFFNSDPAQMGG